MFDFLKKKIYLGDLLEDFHDIHCHLLWGVDDGAPNQEATDKLSEELHALGFSHAYLTPHIIYGLYNNQNEESLRRRFAELVHNDKVEFRLAAEYFLDEQFGSHLQHPEQLLTMGGDWLLVEYGVQATRATHLDQLFEASLGGFNIIIAHPERYSFAFEARNMHEIERLTSKGHALQLNLLSLTGHHGARVRRIAEELLLGGHYTFVGSDTHSHIYPHTIGEATISPKVADALKPLIENNKKVLWK